MQNDSIKHKKAGYTEYPEISDSEVEQEIEQTR